MRTMLRFSLALAAGAALQPLAFAQYPNPYNPQLGQPYPQQAQPYYRPTTYQPTGMAYYGPTAARPSAAPPGYYQQAAPSAPLLAPTPVTAPTMPVLSAPPAAEQQPARLASNEPPTPAQAGSGPEPIPAPVAPPTPSKPDTTTAPSSLLPVSPEPGYHASIDSASVDTADHADTGYCFGDHQHSIYGDFLYLKPRGNDLSFVQARDGCANNSVPKGPQGTLNADYAPGFRVGGELAIDKCSGVVVEFSWWENQTTDHEVALGSTVLQSTLTLPSTINCSTSSKEALGKLATEFRTGDIAYTRILCGDGKCCVVNWLAGAYYAHLNQDLHTEFSILGTTTVDTHINFDGAGPRVGLEGEGLICKGIYAYGRGTANLVAGHFSGSFTQDNVFAGNQGNITFRDDRIVPILDLELGVGWTSAKGNIRVLAGYQVSAWFNSLLTPEFINAVQTNNFTHQGDNLSNTLWFDGVLARVEFRF